MNPIFKRAIIYSIGNYSSKLVSVLIFPIVVTYLGLADAGEFDLIFSTINILAIIFSLQIGDAIYRWFNTKDLKEQQISFSNSTVVIIVMFIIVTIAYLVMYFFYPNLIEFLSVSYFILMSQIILGIYLQIIRGIDDINAYTVIGIVKSIMFSLGSLLMVIYTDNKLYNILLMALGTNVICVLMATTRVSLPLYFNRGCVNLKNSLILIKYSTPLILNAFSWVSFFTINKYIILFYFGMESNGVFAVTEKIATGVFFCGMFYYFSVQDYCLSNSNFKGEFIFFKKMMYKVVLLTSVSILSILLLSWFVVPMYFQDLEASLKFLPYLAIANLFIILANYLGIPYNYMKQTFSMALTSFFGALISVVLSLFFGSIIGILGICVSIIIGTIYIFIMRLRYSLKFFNYRV